jgi:hypothetical protein
MSCSSAQQPAHKRPAFVPAVAVDTMQVEAMARLDAMLGRSLLDAPDDGEGEAPAPNLWLDDEPGASPDAPRIRRKGSYEVPRQQEARSERGSGRKWRDWYRIPDSMSTVACVSVAFTQYQEEAHDTHGTGTN